MKRKIRLVAYSFLALALLLWATPVLALPPIPQAFYGTVKINNVNAAIGTVVSAKINGVNAGSYTTTVRGQYGSLTERDYLAVSYDGATDGDTIRFYVNSRDTGQTATFEVAGGPTEKNLTVTIPTGGGGIAVTPTIKAKLFGVEFTFSISEDGEVLETIRATSEDGNFTITIPEGTIALDEYGDPLESLEVDVDESPPDPPEDAHIIGLAYDLGPDGATFDPPITITFIYDPDDLPEDLEDEGDLVLAYYDEDAGEWVELVCVVDTVNNTITAEVDHFTIFTIIAPAPAPPVAPPPVLAPAAFTSSSLSISPLEVDIGKTVTISVLLSNTGEEEGSYTITLKINGVVEKTKEITLAGGASETVTFTTSKDKAGIYSVDVNGLIGSFTVKEVAPPPAPPPAPPEVKPEVNWPVVVGVIAAVVVVGLLIFFMVRRRAV